MWLRTSTQLLKIILFPSVVSDKYIQYFIFLDNIDIVMCQDNSSAEELVPTSDQLESSTTHEDNLELLTEPLPPELNNSVVSSVGKEATPSKKKQRKELSTMCIEI